MLSEFELIRRFFTRRAPGAGREDSRQHVVP